MVEQKNNRKYVKTSQYFEEENKLKDLVSVYRAQSLSIVCTIGVRYTNFITLDSLTMICCNNITKTSTAFIITK